MEPRTGSGEQAPQTPQIPQPEQWAPPSVPEQAQGLAGHHEQIQPVIEQPLGAPQAEMQPAPPVISSTSLPAPQTDEGGGAQAAAVSDDTPLVAADEDVIEKEWVDKAKRIISETKDDPHMREQQIKKLQVEYIRKRYGREIGEATE